MIWWQILGEMALLSLLGVGYYFFQKNRYLRWLREEPQVVAKDLFLYLNAEEGIPNSDELANLLRSLEDFLEQRRDTWPTQELEIFYSSLPTSIPSNIMKKITSSKELINSLFG